MIQDLYNNLLDMGLELGYMKRVRIEDERATFALDERDALEAEAAGDIERALQIQFDAILADPANASRAIEENSDELRKALLALLVAAYLLGNDSGAGMLASVGLAVDAGQSGQGAGQFAQRRIVELLNQVNGTTRTAVLNMIAQWQQTGGDSDDLAKLIEKTFSDARAGLISTTEVTNAFAGGVEAVALLAGVGVMEWYTMQDERVCVICRPMNGKRRLVTGRYASELPVQDSPPAHPRCRCGEVMLVQSILS